jgi:amidohydrolase
MWPALLAVLAASPVVNANDPLLAPLPSLLPELDALYQDLHRTPELSNQEVKTAEKLATRLKALGFEVTTNVGGHGVVGVLKNGKGPTVLVRADMDGLPVLEKTGLPYASTVVAKDPSGREVPVMHACGHDVHMTAWTAAATLLSRGKSRWRGTLIMLAQPAEEGGHGALAMLRDGLYTRFPKPDFAIGIHDTADFPAGVVALSPGFIYANVDSVDITFHGRGSHGSRPHNGVDPIVMASRAVVALQTLVSREKDPFEPAVITVGSFQAGTKHNIIPDEAKLQITVRSYKDTVRKSLLAGIERIAKAEAVAAGAPKPPVVQVLADTNSTFNDAEVVEQLRPTLVAVVGEKNVVAQPPLMGGEDFSEYRRDGVKATMFAVGVANPKAHAEAVKTGVALPTTHSPLFAPDKDPTITTASLTLTAAAYTLLGRPSTKE